jgi:Tfp pilus assembly protein PilV
MLRSLCNKRGMGIIEVVIAMFLTTVAVLALLSLQSSGWRTTGMSDLLGRSSGILHKTLEAYEAQIMNPCNAVTLGAQPAATVYVSGVSGTAGDMAYTVNADIAADGAGYRVTVTVTWPQNATGLSESLTVARQESHRFGCAAI